MNASRIDAELKVLLDALSVAQERGQAGEANRLLAKARALAPNHEAVMNAMAIAALRAGNPVAARELLEKAVAKRPHLQPLWMNLAAATRLLGDLSAEAAALERAIALEPRDYIARLQQGELMLKVGREAEALDAFQQALGLAPPAGQVPATTAERLDRAVSLLRGRAERMAGHLEAALAPVRAEQDGQALARFDQGVAALLGAGRIYPSQATFFQLPELPAVPYFTRDGFPWLAALEAQTAALTGEALDLLAHHGEAFVPYVNLGSRPMNEAWAALNGSASWSYCPLIWHGRPVAGNLERAPVVREILASLPLFDVAGNAPNVCYTVIRPRTAIPPHFGATNARVRLDLPLAAGEGARARVGARIRPLVRGEALVFDDTIEHELINDSTDALVLFSADVWNPHLSELERRLTGELFTASAAFMGVGSVFEGRL